MDYEFDAVGLAAAGFASSDRKHMIFGPNIRVARLPARPRRSRALIDGDVTVVVENDANAAGWAEYVTAPRATPGTWSC